MITTTLLYIIAITTAQAAIITEASQTHKQEHKTTIRLSLDDIVPKQESLEETLTNYHQKVCQALIQALKHQEKGTLLKYLPSASYNFNELALSISYSLSKLSSNINRQRAKKAKVKTIKEHMQTELQGALAKLNKHYANLEAEVKLYNHTARIYQLKKELFKLKRQQYQNLEITPTEYIQSQIKIKTEKLKLNKHYTSIIKLRNRILELAKANHNYEKSP